MDNYRDFELFLSHAEYFNQFAGCDKRDSEGGMSIRFWVGTEALKQILEDEFPPLEHDSSLLSWIVATKYEPCPECEAVKNDWYPLEQTADDY